MRFDQPRGPGRDRLLPRLPARQFGGEAGLVDAALLQRGGAAVHLRYEATLDERFEVAADGYVGDTEFADEIGDPHAAEPPSHFPDPLLALLCEHHSSSP